MSDEAEFTVRLTDKVSGSARDAQRALGGMSNQFDKAEKAAASADKALGRFTDKRGRIREKNGRFFGGDGGGRRDGGFSSGGGGGGGSGASGGRGGGFGGFGPFGLGGFSGAMDVFKGNLLTMAASGLGKVAAGAAAAGVEFTTFGQNTKLALGNLTKHGVDPEKLFEHSRELAKRFGLDLMDTTDAYKKFLALQFNPKQADELIRMGADLRMLNNDAEGVKGIFLAIGQIKAKDRLQAQELLQLSERGVSTELVHGSIAKALGKSTDEVRKLQEAGKISAAVGLRGIQDAVMAKLQEKSLGEAGAKFADETIDGLTGRAKAMYQDTGVKTFEQVAAPATKSLGIAVTKTESWLRSPEGQDAVSTTASALGSLVSSAADAVMSTAKGFWDTGTAMGTQVADWKAMLSEGRVLGTAADMSLKLAPLTPIIDMTARSFDLGKQMVLGIVDGINTFANDPPEAMVQVAMASEMAARAQLGIHSPSKVFAGIGLNTGAGLALGIERSTGAVRAAGADLGRASTASVEDAMFGPMATTTSAPPSFAGGSAGTGAGFGPVTITIPIDINGVSDPEQAGDAAGRSVRRELETFFRQLSMET